MSLDWDGVTAFALSLEGAAMSTSYGKPAVKVNGRAFVMTGREAGSFCLALDPDTIEMLKDSDPDSFWQTPHYEGWSAVLVRFDSPDPDRVRAVIVQSHGWNAARPRPRARKPKA